MKFSPGTLTTLLFCAVMALVTARSSLAAEYAISPDTSSIVLHFHYANNRVTEGRGTPLSGIIAYDPQDPELTVVGVISDFNSATTSDKTTLLGRAVNWALTSGVFLQINKNDGLTFSSGNVTHVIDPNHFIIEGTLSLHGIQKTIPLRVTRLITNAGGVQIKAVGQFKRSDFGLSFNKVVEKTSLLSDVVDVEITMNGFVRDQNQ